MAKLKRSKRERDYFNWLRGKNLNKIYFVPLEIPMGAISECNIHNKHFDPQQNRNAIDFMSCDENNYLSWVNAVKIILKCKPNEKVKVNEMVIRCYRYLRQYNKLIVDCFVVYPYRTNYVADDNGNVEIEGRIDTGDDRGSTYYYVGLNFTQVDMPDIKLSIDFETDLARYAVSVYGNIYLSSVDWLGQGYEDKILEIKSKDANILDII